MFSNDDFISYFSDLEMIEKNMRDIYVHALTLIEDRDIRVTFQNLADAEARHTELVSDVRSMVIRLGLMKE